MVQPHPLPTDAEQLRAYTRERWEAFVATVDTLPLEQWEIPTDAAGWTVKDHVAHVVLWDESLVGLVRDGTPRQQTLRVSDTAWNAGGYDARNEEIRDHTHSDSVASVQQRRDASWQVLWTLLSSYDDVTIQKPGADFGLNYGENESYLETLVDDLGVHYDQHRTYIEAILAGGEA